MPNTPHTLALLALDHAFDALQVATLELGLAAALVPADSAAATDALVLAQAVELEALATHECVLRLLS